MEIRTIAERFIRAIERFTKTDVTYLIRSGFWSNAGTIFVSLASFLLYIVFNRYVSKDVYGTYQYLLSIGAIVGAFTLTGMNSAVTRAVALGQEGALRVAIRRQLQWAIVPLLGSWALGAYYLIAHGNTTLGFGLMLIGIFVPITNAFNTYGAFLQGKKDFKRGFLYSLWWNVPYYLSVGIVAIFFKAALILLAANLISQAVGLFVSYRATVAAYKPNDLSDASTLTYGSHLSVMGLLGSIASQIDAILAFHFLGATQLAIYSFSTAIPDRVGGLFKFIPAAAFPKFVGKSPAEIRQGLGRRLLLGTITSTVLALAYVAIAYPFFYVFFPAYLVAVPYSQFYALTLTASMGGVLTNALVAAGNVRTLYIYNTVNPVVQIGLLIVGILMYGLAGLIVARILASLFVLVFGIVLYWRAK
jgi:O-antigen/teichoic acid export membrane protein